MGDLSCQPCGSFSRPICPAGMKYAVGCKAVYCRYELGMAALVSCGRNICPQDGRGAAISKFQVRLAKVGGEALSRKLYWLSLCKTLEVMVCRYLYMLTSKTHI